MTTKKGHIGFRTPAKALEEQYEAIISMLDTKGKSWLNKKSEALSACEKLLIIAEKQKKQNHLTQFHETISSISFLFTVIFIFDLGIELGNTQKRLAKIENKLASLK